MHDDQGLGFCCNFLFTVRVGSCISRAAHRAARCSALQIFLLVDREERRGSVQCDADSVLQQETCGSYISVPILVFESRAVLENGAVQSSLVGIIFLFFLVVRGCALLFRLFYLLFRCGSEHTPCLLRKKAPSDGVPCRVCFRGMLLG